MQGLPHTSRDTPDTPAAYRVSYRIETGIDGSTVTTKTINVMATSDLNAVDAARTWAEHNDPYFDPRIDARFVVIDVARAGDRACPRGRGADLRRDAVSSQADEPTFNHDDAVRPEDAVAFLRDAISAAGGEVLDDYLPDEQLRNGDSGYVIADIRVALPDGRAVWLGVECPHDQAFA